MSLLSYETIVKPFSNEESLQALHRLNAARAEIKQYLPKNFDPDQELEEARKEKLILKCI